MAASAPQLMMAVLSGAGALGAGLVFVGAGVAKLRHRVLFPGVVANYRLLPDGLVAPVAAVLPLVELALGAGLIAALVVGGWFALVTGLAAAGLLLVFAGAMAVNLRRGRGHIDCGCGHPELRQPLSWLLVGRNLVLAVPLVALGLVWLPLRGLDLVSVAAGGVVAALVYYLFNALAALLSSPLSASLLPVRR